MDVIVLSGLVLGMVWAGVGHMRCMQRFRDVAHQYGVLPIDPNRPWHIDYRTSPGPSERWMSLAERAARAQTVSERNSYLAYLRLGWALEVTLARDIARGRVLNVPEELREAAAGLARAQSRALVVLVLLCLLIAGAWLVSGAR